MPFYSHFCIHILLGFVPSDTQTHTLREHVALPTLLYLAQSFVSGVGKQRETWQTVIRQVLKELYHHVRIQLDCFHHQPKVTMFFFGCPKRKLMWDCLEDTISCNSGRGRVFVRPFLCHHADRSTFQISWWPGMHRERLGLPSFSKHWFWPFWPRYPLVLDGETNTFFPLFQLIEQFEKNLWLTMYHHGILT